MKGQGEVVTGWQNKLRVRDRAISHRLACWRKCIGEWPSRSADGQPLRYHTA